MTLLTLVQEVCATLALSQPTVVVTSTDRQVLQMWALANREGHDLASAYSWQALRQEELFATLAQQQQTGFMPADFDRFVPNSFFNRSTRRQLSGPITPQQHQWIQAQPVYSTAYQAFIMRNNQMLFDPNPAAGNTVAFEYITKNWVLSNAAVPQSSYLADTDTSRLDEDLMAQGLLWRFLRTKGLDYAEEMESYERNKEQAMARDGGSTAMNVAPRAPDPDRMNLPDGNFPA